MMQAMQKKKLVLASGSPRRRELLAAAGVTFTVDAADIHEEMSHAIPGQRLVMKLALLKAEAVARRHRNAVVIAADTVVSIGKYNWSKPESRKEARMMLAKLSGRTHQVWTGFAIVDTKSGRRVVRAVSSDITMRSLSKREIDSHVKKKEAIEGAGGYMLQKQGAALIKKIEGDYTNIVGLPLPTVLKELKKFSIRV
jgi:septum formation protein